MGEKMGNQKRWAFHSTMEGGTREVRPRLCGLRNLGQRQSPTPQRGCDIKFEKGGAKGVKGKYRHSGGVEKRKFLTAYGPKKAGNKAPCRGLFDRPEEDWDPTKMGVPQA